MKEGRKIEGRKDVQAGWKGRVGRKDPGKDDGVKDGRTMIEMKEKQKR
jgi:hypothetical protein